MILGIGFNKMMIIFLTSFLNISAGSCKKSNNNIIQLDKQNKVELEYVSSKNKSSIVFFGFIGKSSQKNLSFWKGLKIRDINGNEFTVIDTVTSEVLIADIALNNEISVCKWSPDQEVFMFHISLVLEDEGMEKVNIGNCTE